MLMANRTTSSLVVHFFSARLTIALMATRHQREACLTRLQKTQFAEDIKRQQLPQHILYILYDKNNTILNIVLILFLRLSVFCQLMHFPLPHFQRPHLWENNRRQCLETLSLVAFCGLLVQKPRSLKSQCG